MKRYRATIYSAEPSDGNPRDYTVTTSYERAAEAAQRKGTPARPMRLYETEPGGRKRLLSRHPPRAPDRSLWEWLFHRN